MSTQQQRFESGTPIARLEFAQRLRELRVPRGFRTARSLAKALDIDENRYTRYERAEVEPDLTMIRRICATLGVTPDALLSPLDFDDEPDQASKNGKVPCHAGADTSEESSGHTSTSSGHNGTGGNTQAPQTAAWFLAEAATGLMRQHNGPAAVAPLAMVAETCRLYQALMERPFETISQLLMQSDVSHANVEAANALRTAIEQFVSSIKPRG